MTYRMRMAVVAVACAAGAGCSGNSMGGLGEILGGVLGQPAGQGQTGQVTVEIQAVDAQQQAISVATQQGERGTVRYDGNTVVVYQQRQYPVTALERGDIVNMQVQQVQGGGLYTARIDVQQSVQERTGQSPATGNQQLMQLSGPISQIDHREGWFVLRTQNGNVTVYLPLNAPQATSDYFHRLRTGDNVRLEATRSASGTMQIHRFL